MLKRILFSFVAASLAWTAGAWELPDIHGDAKDGWRPGRNWNANPFLDNGAQWSLFYQSPSGFKLMEQGKAYRYNFVWRDAGDSFDPATFFIDTKLKTQAGAAVLFSPGHPGKFKVSLQGTAAGQASLALCVTDKSLASPRPIVKVDRKDKESFTWDGEVELKDGESLAFLLRSANPRWVSFTFKRFSVEEVGGKMFSGAVPTRAADWKPRDPEVSVKDGPDGGLTLEVSPGAKDWYVVDGPALQLPKRDKFAQGRAMAVSAEAWPEKPGDYAISNYALQVRAKQDGGNYTRNRAPHFYWESSLELTNAQKMRDWTTIEGSSTLYPHCGKLNFELWLAAPKTGKSVIHLRKLELKESFATSHLLAAEPAAQNNVFFADSGAIKVEFANTADLKEWRVEDLDELGRTLLERSGQGSPAPLTVPLPGFGFHKLVATATYKDGAKIESSSTAAVVGAALPEDVRMKSRFGSMRVHGDPGFWKKSGCRWDWGIGGIELKDWILTPDGSIVPPPDWKTLKKSTDYSVIYSVRNFPKWLYGPDYKDDGGLYPPKDWGLFERLFEAFAKANPEITYFTPYNEGNGAWRGNAEEYIKFCTAMADGARRGNPACEVYGPGDYAILMDSFQRYVDGGMYDHLGGVNIHAYVNASSPEGEFIERVIQMAASLKAAGKGDLPVYFTEFGWCSGTGDWQKTIPGIERSRYVARSLSLLSAQPVDGILYFCFHYVGISDGEPGYSLLNSNGTPTMSYVAFVNVVKWLSQVKRGDARWFRLSPNLNMVLGRADGKIVGAAWTCEGEADFELPGVPLRATDFMGRPAPLTRQARLSPSPLFFELPPDNQFIDLRELPQIASGLGASLDVGLDSAVGHDGVTSTGVAATAKPGKYLLIGKRKRGFWDRLFNAGAELAAQPVEVLPPLEFKALDCAVAPDCKSMDIVALVASTIGGKAKATLSLDSGENASVTGDLTSGSNCKLTIPALNFKSGSRIKGKVVVETVGAIPYRVEMELDKSVLPCPVVKGMVDWSRIKGVDISKWSPSAEAGIPASDCSAVMRTAIAADGFHLKVEVTDNVHLQTAAPGGMWQEDSLQLAFDVDGDKEWQFNNIADGRYSGHRIFYYDVCLPSDGRPAIVWRNRADCPGVSAKCLEPKVVAKIAREGVKTVYDLTFPWGTLGLDKAPTAGRGLGFAIAVNDADKGVDRRFLRFGNGIVDGQRPERYATLQACGE